LNIINVNNIWTEMRMDNDVETRLDTYDLEKAKTSVNSKWE
jgi:hypothetical protein